MDIYEPTLDALYYLGDVALVNRGYIMLDDYGNWTCPGIKAAVDRFMENHEQSFNFIYLPTGQGLLQRVQ
jgi:hypothetical protein